ncbi:hypothetical protein ACPCDX_29355 [Streptomyces koyangensis]|uniref:hypothetical protein n=1 Tax=Streptomyces koyangensis TaxID=188770 RepID=UPI003C2BB09B
MTNPPLNPDKQPEAPASPDSDELPWEPEGPTPTDPEPTPDPDPEPDPDPIPAPPPIDWEPATWYSITYACRNAGCANRYKVYSAPEFYSNNGLPAYIQVIDSTCGKRSTILTATKLDPQPEEE